MQHVITRMTSYDFVNIATIIELLQNDFDIVCMPK